MSQTRMIFPNLPVVDVDATKAFWTALGFTFNPKFSDPSCLCLEVNEHAYVMLMERDRFAGFLGRPVADPAQATAGILCVSADTREAVDELADAALAAGGTRILEPVDHGFMYGRSFYDLDGHHWEVMWMDPVAVEQGPADMAEQSA